MYASSVGRGYYRAETGCILLQECSLRSQHKEVTPGSGRREKQAEHQGGSSGAEKPRRSHHAVRFDKCGARESLPGAHHTVGKR